MNNSADLHKQILDLVEVIKRDIGAHGCILITLTFVMVSAISSSGDLSSAGIALNEAARLAEAMRIDRQKFQDYYNDYSLLKLEIYALEVETDNTTVN